MWIATLDSGNDGTSPLGPVNDALFSVPPALLAARGTATRALRTENGVTC